MKRSDIELERLSLMADRYAAQQQELYVVANLNMVGARSLVVRPAAMFASEPERVLYTARPPCGRTDS